MARLPQVGGDKGNWGDILNDFLLQSHTADGTIKPGAVASSQLASGAITDDKIAVGTIAEDKLSSAVQNKLNTTATGISDGSVTTPKLADDAVTSAKLADNAVDTASLQDNSVSEPKLAAQNSPTTGDFLSWNGTAMRWSAQASAPVTSVAGKTGAVTLTKSDVGLANVDNTSDASKPISSATQTALNAKVDKVSSANRLYGTDGSGTQGTYEVGTSADGSVVVRTTNNRITVGTPTATDDATTKNYVDTAIAAIPAAPVTSVAGKTGAVTLVKGDVGLGNVDNTSDANKPISTATQSALDGKQALLTSGTNIKTVNGNSLLGSGNVSVPVGDVVGPASSTDKAIVRYSGTTGKAIQDSGVTIDDNGYIGVTSGTIYLNATASAINIPSTGYLRFGTTDIKKPHVLVTGDTYSSGPGKIAFRYGTNGTSFDYVDGTNNPVTRMSIDTTGNLTTSGTINGRDVAADATKIVNNGMGVVVHGATAGTARPTGFACITWIGSVQPTNAATNDIWVYKA